MKPNSRSVYSDARVVLFRNDAGFFTDILTLSQKHDIITLGLKKKEIFIIEGNI